MELRPLKLNVSSPKVCSFWWKMLWFRHSCVSLEERMYSGRKPREKIQKRWHSFENGFSSLTCCISLKNINLKAHVFLVFSRWWNLPGHLQRLFTHGLKQPREAQTPQCRPQILASCCLLFTPPYNATLQPYIPSSTRIENMLVSNSQACRPTHIFPGHLPHVQS